MTTCRPQSTNTHEHDPACDDNGWDHPGPCVLDQDEDGPTDEEMQRYRENAARLPRQQTTSEMMLEDIALDRGFPL